MAGTRKVLGTAMKFGVKYGPHMVGIAAVAKEPAKKAASAYLASRATHRQAIDHATTLVDGSVLKVVHEGATVWVVFSGDDPVTAYQAVPVGLDDLLAHADLSHRVRPEAVPSRATRIRTLVHRRRVGPQGGTMSTGNPPAITEDSP